MNKKVAYAIPNIFTAASLIAALVALIQASDGFFQNSAWLITLSIVLDGLDGRMARILNATSKIGAQADSLADFVAFGVVPGFLAWQVGLHKLGFFGFMTFIVYVLCGGFRLARFNVMSANAAKKEDFVGLPIPAAAATVSSFVLFNELVIKDYDWSYYILLGIMAFVSYLMVSKIPYFAPTKTRKIKKYIPLICAIFTGIIVLAIKYGIWVYFVGIWLYVSYGLFNMLIKTVVTHQEHRAELVKHRRVRK